MGKKLILTLALILAIGTQAIAQNASMGAGSKGEEVKKVQERLVQLNYLSDTADGIFGKNTALAVAAFQEGNGLTPTGTVDERTREALDSGDANSRLVPLKRGDKGTQVKSLQDALIRYGFLSGTADGEYGKATDTAVKALQKHMTAQGEQTEATGRVDEALYRALTGDMSVFLTPLSQGDEGDEVRRMQKRLGRLGYFDDDANGTFGEYTHSALHAFQKRAGLAVSGTLDRITSDAMFARDAVVADHPTPRTLTPRDSGRLVEAVQGRLIELGFLGGLVDGSYGSATQSALTRLVDHLKDRDGYDWAKLGSGGALSPEFQEHLLDEEIPVYVRDVSSGDRNSQASRVQRRLHSLYYLGLPGVDGKFGKNSVDAVNRFQTLNGLDPTGVADEKTQRVLFSAEAIYDQTPYILRVNIADQRTYVYQLGENGAYTLIKSMLCSTGLPGSETPKGIFRKTGPQDRWHYFTKFVCWAQYTYYIDGDIMFHSVLYSGRNENTLRTSSVRYLGRKASHGCVRLAVEDVKWIFENCEKGTIIVVE